MLSYRHAFHAGNFADVLKHLVLCACLEYLTRKPSPVLYLDTHAGAGRYSLQGEWSRKTGEAEAGILRLDLAAAAAGLDPQQAMPLLLYRDLLAPFLSQRHYPGSPSLAAALLRPADRLRLFELHPEDHALLQERFSKDRRVRCERADGFQGIKALLPMAGFRPLLLVDPSYEIKEDFRRAAEALQQAHRRAPGAQLLLWYPLLRDAPHQAMLNTLAKSGIRDLWRIELGVAPGAWNRGMSASGMLVANPPWQLPEQLRHCLPPLHRQLAGDEGYAAVENLVPE